MMPPIPSSVKHPINLAEFRLQNFASSSPYLDKARTPARLSLEIMKGFNVGALTGNGISFSLERAHISKQ